MCLTESGFKQLLLMCLTVDMCLTTTVCCTIQYKVLAKENIDCKFNNFITINFSHTGAAKMTGTSMTIWSDEMRWVWLLTISNG